MNTPNSLLEDAKRAEPKQSLATQREAIQTLRDKDYTWREIAQFFNERGFDTDHTKLFRLMNRRERTPMTPDPDFVVPPADRYVAALSTIQPRLSKEQKEMLQFHFRAHNRTATFGELAEAAHLKNFRGANMEYGKLGRMLGEELGMTFSTNELSGDPFYSSSIGNGSPIKTSDARFRQVMHHELAKALKTLGWFEN